MNMETLDLALGLAGKGAAGVLAATVLWHMRDSLVTLIGIGAIVATAEMVLGLSAWAAFGAVAVLFLPLAMLDARIGAWRRMVRPTPSTEPQP